MLFNTRLLKNEIEKFELPTDYEFARVQKILGNWQSAIRDGNYDKTKETQVQSSFLNLFFNVVLGYAQMQDNNEEWHLINEAKTEFDGTKADGALGYFYKNEQENITRAVIELKDAKTPLDKKQTARKDYDSPISQAFSYCSKIDRCDWVIVSNFKEIRLYNKERGQGFYEKFEILNLHDSKEFKRFYFCLCKENLLDKNRNSLLDNLVKDTTKNEDEITKKFYKEFKIVRQELFEHICENNPQIDKKYLLEKTQKLLDRMVFIFFCEDTPGLLPDEITKQIYKLGLNSRERSDVKVWREFKNLFIDIDEGRHDIDPPINAYNGGLFAYDKVLDNLVIKDFVWEKIVNLSSYNFESDLNVNILGHIFEQSLSDLEQIKAEIDGATQDKTKSKRKKDGIFYTPEYITKYIVEQTVGKYLEENPDKLETIKILDPACGSGAFINQAHSFLKQEYKNRVEEKLNEGEGARNLSVFEHTNMAANDRSILLNNLFGVDLNEESVEITKLALWLKTAKKDQPLQNLDNNIKCGNSLIDDPEVAGDKAFRWEEEFKNVMDDGGFDVIIGNPPYVDNRGFDKNQLNYFFENYEVFTKSGTSKFKTRKFNTFVAFFEQAYNLLKEGGMTCFIVQYFLLKNFEISEIVDWGAGQFEDVVAETISIVLTKKSAAENLIKISSWSNEGINTKNSVEQASYSKTHDNIFNINNNIEISDLINKFDKNILKLSELIIINNGIVTGNDKKYIANTQKSKYCRHCISGREIKRYSYLDPQNYIYYKQDELLRPRNEKIFLSSEKLIMQMININLVVSHDDKQIFNLGTTYSLNKKNNCVNLYFILSILNSSTINFYYQKKFTNQSSLTNAISTKNLELFPIPDTSPEQQDSLAQKAEGMIDLNKELYEKLSDNLNYLKSKYSIEKPSQKLEKFYTLGGNEFLEQLQKAKVKLEMKQEQELLKWFEESKKELCEIDCKIKTLDNIIDQEVYALYDLNEDEIKIIEGK